MVCVRGRGCQANYFCPKTFSLVELNCEAQEGMMWQNENKGALLAFRIGLGPPTQTISGSLEVDRPG